MNSCSLKKIPSLQSLSKLKSLDLNSNDFHVIESNAFIGGNQLTNLSLSSNQIEIIENEAFSNLLFLKVKLKSVLTVSVCVSHCVSCVCMNDMYNSISYNNKVLKL